MFTRIIEGEVPVCFLWRDPSCVAFLNITPLAPGHTLVVPKEEIAHWIDLGPGLAAHLMSVSQVIGKALLESFEPQKIGLAIAGLEIPHAHVWPIHGPMSFTIDPDEGDPSACSRLRARGVMVLGLRGGGAGGGGSLPRG